MAFPKHHGFAALAILIVTLFVYANSLSSPFIFDDGPNIRDNQLIRSWEAALHPDRYCSTVHPMSDEALICHFFRMRHIGYLSFALNYAANGLHVEGYHAVNICIHLCNSLLIYLLVLLLQRTPALAESKGDRLKGAAVFAALLFAAHPLQTQAVTYIVQRLTSLATFFYLLSVVLYISMRLMQTGHASKKYGQRFSPTTTGLYVLSLVSAVMAMKTKEIAFTLPVTIALGEFIFFEGRALKRAAIVFPFLLTMLIIPLQLIGMDSPASGLIGDMRDVSRVRSDLSRKDYLLTQMTVIAKYLQLLIFPAGQNADYDYRVYRSLSDPRVLISTLLILTLVTAGVFLLLRYRKRVPRTRIISFGIFWFFIALSVESSVIPILDVIFEHRVYLPSAGFCIAASISLSMLAGRLGKRTPWIKKAAPAAAGIVIILLAGAAYARNMVWQDEVTFWSDVTAKSPGKPRGYLNLGLAYQNRGDLDKALANYNKALSLKALSYPPLVNRGSIYAALGQHEKAIRDFTDAISINPYVPVAYYNRGMSHVFLGQKELAVGDFTSVIELKPGYAEAYNNRGSMYGDMGETEKAIADFSSAIALQPDFPGFYANRAHAFVMKRSYEGAVRDFSRAMELDPGKASWLVARGNAYLSLGEREKAEVDFRKACSMGDAAGCEAVK